VTVPTTSGSTTLHLNSLISMTSSNHELQYLYMMMNIQSFLKKYKGLVDVEIAKEMEKRGQEVKELSPHLVPILQAMNELSVGGKRLRAMLTILGYEIARNNSAKPDPEMTSIIKAGVVMEIFHLGLLIQDDFMDRDMERRGVPTLIARYKNEHQGNFISMLAGDYTFGWGIEIMSGLEISPERVKQAMAVWGRYFSRVGYGQTLDGLDIADDSTIMQILELKSGEYSCVLPLLLGATLGGASEELKEKLRLYGMELGWVFQLRDDYLGYEKDMTKKGKRTYATMNGKAKTLNAIAQHTELAKKWGLSLRGSSSQDRILLELVEWLGTREN